MQRCGAFGLPGGRRRFQSPIHRGDRCNGIALYCLTSDDESFSPLFIGVIGATPGVPKLGVTWLANFQSPIHRGDRCNREAPGRGGYPRRTFSPLFIGVIGATAIQDGKTEILPDAFSPLFIGVIGATA